MSIRTTQQKYNRLKEFLVTKNDGHGNIPQGWELLFRCQDTVQVFESLWMNEQPVYDRIDSLRSQRYFAKLRESVLRDMIGQLYMLSGADTQSKDFMSLMSLQTMNEIKPIVDAERIEWKKTLDPEPPIVLNVTYSCSFPTQEHANSCLADWDKNAFDRMKEAENELPKHYKVLSELRNRRYFHVTDTTTLSNTPITTNDIFGIIASIRKKFDAMTLYINRSSWGDYLEDKTFKVQFSNLLLKK